MILHLSAKSDAETDFESRLGKVRTADEYRHMAKETTGRKPRQLGGGSHAAVYSHPFYRDRVVKVQYRDGPDHCWDAYLDFAESNPSPYTPKIHLRRDTLAVMERLRDWSWQRAAVAMQSDPFPVVFSVMLMTSPGRGMKPWQETNFWNHNADIPALIEGARKAKLDRTRSFLALASNDPDSTDTQEAKSAAYTELDRKRHRFAQFVRKLVKATPGCRLDFQTSNFMFRADGTFVLNDPLW